MNREQIIQLVKEVVGEVLSLPPGQIHLTQDFWDDEVTMDSCDIGELTLELEERLGVEFSDEELDLFASFDAVIDLLEVKLDT